MGGSGHHVRIGDGGRMEPGGDQSGNVGHIHKKIGPYLVGDIRKGLEVDGAGIGGGTSQDHLGLVFFS